MTIEVMKASAVQEIIDNSFDPERWDEIVGSINKRLQDQTFLKDWRCGTKEDGYYYRFGAEGELNKKMTQLLEESFIEAGWKKVEIVNNATTETERASHCIILTLPVVA